MQIESMIRLFSLVAAGGNSDDGGVGEVMVVVVLV